MIGQLPGQAKLQDQQASRAAGPVKQGAKEQSCFLATRQAGRLCAHPPFTSASGVSAGAGGRPFSRLGMSSTEIEVASARMA